MTKELNEFYEPLHIEIHNDGSLTLLRNFIFVVEDFGGYQEIICVPAGFKSTAYNLFGFRLGNYGVKLKASIMHEYLYYLADKYNSKANYSKKEADEMLYKIMQRFGYKRVTIWLILFYVRIKSMIFIKY